MMRLLISHIVQTTDQFLETFAAGVSTPAQVPIGRGWPRLVPSCGPPGLYIIIWDGLLVP